MERKVYPVSQVNRYVKAILSQDRILSGIWISGEISNYKRHSSGHRYFTLKDDQGAISAVMFASYAGNLKFSPSDGMHVIVHGEITLYEKTGSYQICVYQMEEAGQGVLYQAYLRLKEKLEKEGLFAPETRKKLPFAPRTVGIITSPTGAAVRDMIRTLKRRSPGVQIVFCPAQVQGPDASFSLSHALDVMNRDGRAEVILFGRGGGSLEDLWAFNEEETVRAVKASRIPVIAGIGHETDTTLCDFAADLRAATPTAAAELAVPTTESLTVQVQTLQQQMESAMRRKLMQSRRGLNYYTDRSASRILHMKIHTAQQQVDQEADAMQRAVQNRLQLLHTILSHHTEAMRLLDPNLPVQRGYSLLMSGDRTITSVTQLSPGQTVCARLSDGKAQLTVDALYDTEEYQDGTDI